MFLSGGALYGALLLLPLYWQEVRGYGALGAGLLLIPQEVGALLARGATTRVLEHLNARTVSIVGFALVGVSTAPFAFAGAHTAIWLLMVTLLVRGFGMGAVSIPLITVAFDGLPNDDVPNASIVVQVGQQVGGSVGTALFAVILADQAAASGSLTTGFNIAFWCATGFTVVAALLSFLLPGRSGADTASAETEPVASAVQPANA